MCPRTDRRRADAEGRGDLAERLVDGAPLQGGAGAGQEERRRAGPRAESVAPGGDFVATASAIDAAGNLSFNYTLTAGGPPGTKFGSSLTVESAANGALRG